MRDLPGEPVDNDAGAEQVCVGSVVWSTLNGIQQIFYGAALVAAITIPKVNRGRFFKRKRPV